ncbi:MAG: DUF1552 domain-containing protein, partial [Myxococcota bacterium]
LTETLEPLRAYKEDCVFLNGLSMGPTDSGSHPGGAQKLLTGVDGGHGESIDQYLARTVGSDRPHRHLYLGAMANHNASGDKHISYPTAGNSVPPEDNPLRAFERLFGTTAPPGGDPDGDRQRAMDISVIDGALAEIQALQAKLGEAEGRKLGLHLEALREVERRIKTDAAEHPGSEPESCTNPNLNTSSVDTNRLYEPDRFPSLLRLQIDLMVQAMACGLTRVGTIQASHHTSELIMSRFEGSEMFDAGFDMRSHQASHYGARHDAQRREFRDFVQQRRWFVQQFAYLLEQLKARPEGDGTMLDHSLVWMCTEVSDGNTHLHDNMPFVLAGRAGGRLSTGRLLQYDYERHSNLLVSMANAMGDPLRHFGQASSGPLSGLLG